jgi:hypothetical protein
LLKTNRENHQPQGLVEEEVEEVAEGLVMGEEEEGKATTMLN